MLVIFSDLHLTDGTSSETISPGAFHLLAERIEDLALRASCRTDGSYRPVERIDVLLLGDVLDVIRSARWQAGTVRPWDNPHSPAMLETVATITRGILRENEGGLGVLRTLANDGAIRLAPANHLTRSMPLDSVQPVPVRIHYMIGNHDWFFHLKGPGYDALRREIVVHLGLANRADAPFPHDPREGDELLETLRRHRVCARHGDIYDPFNFEGDRDASSLGDAIVIELLNRFSARVEAELGEDLPPATLRGLREIDNIRPLLLVPVWIDGLLERTCSFLAMRKEVKQIWDKLADEFLQLPFVSRRDSWSPLDKIDGLQRLLKFSQRLSVGWASAAAAWFHGLRGLQEESYFRHALAEQDFRNRRAKHIVYGHTHFPETVPLDASFADGNVLNQIYFNSGTWRRVHRQTQLAPGEHEFIASDSMTYLAFFQGDERKGRPYEAWTGTLAVARPEPKIFRVDRGTKQNALGESSSAAGLHLDGPHFAPSAARTPLVPTRRV
jgi:UDP-2,3-diacylglucosamine pyrophosphatase LpxH